MKKLKQELSGLIILAAMVFTALVLIDFFRFPECYVPSFRQSMKREIDAGNEEVIQFYNEHYVANGRILFD